MSAPSFKNSHASLMYNKAMDIFQLATQISSYIVHDIAPLQRNGKEDPNIYFTGDIIQQSVSLGPEILKAESQPYQDDRFKYASSVMRLSNRLYNNCKRLQKVNSNGKDFLPLMLKEIRKFRKLQSTWHLTL
ncbi:MAG TPA: hypothetical protein VFD78_05145 [Chitinophagaceae bacterium]|nr:hypothetical protein [Chitinophagaceae bacterium]